MTQAPTALTDFALAIEAGAFAWLINRGRGIRGGRVAGRDDSDATLGRWFVLFFCAAAVASVIGGLVHGYFLDPTTVVARSLWPLALIAVGAAALAAWGIGASIQFFPDRARLFGWISIAEFLIYSGAVVLGMRSFRYAIFNYLPAALFLLSVFTIAYARHRNSAYPRRGLRAFSKLNRLNTDSGDSSYLLGAIAMVVTLAASALQQAKVGILTLGLTHNALYHVLQGVSLLLMFLCARPLTHTKS